VREAAEMNYRLSIFYGQDERLDAAEQSIVAAIRLGERTSGLDELEIADYREQYAAVLAQLGRTEEAAAQIEVVKAIWERSGVPRDDL
jgi:hypothetical protein